MWDNIFYILFAIPGVILSAPVFLLQRITGRDLVKGNDRFDRWSLGHVLAALIWFCIFIRFGFSVGASGLYSFVVMYAYEVVFDMTKIEDKEGFSVLDIGADMLGSLIGVLIWLLI